MVQRMKTCLFCACVALAVGAGAEGAEGKKSGFSGDLSVTMDHTSGYPGNEEYGDAFFYGRGRYQHDFTENLGIVAEGHFGQGEGVTPEMTTAAPADPLTLWDVNSLAYDTFGAAFLRQFYVQSVVKNPHHALIGKADLSELFGSNIGGKNQWTKFVAPGLQRDPLIPFPSPGLSAYYGMKATDTMNVRFAYGEPDSDWEDIFHEQGFFIGEMEQKLGNAGDVKVAIWSAPQMYTHDFGETKTPIGISVDSNFKAGNLDCFVRLGMAPADLYQVDLTATAGCVLHLSETQSVGFGMLGSSWSKDYIDYLPSSFGYAGETQVEVFHRVKLPMGLEVISDAQLLICPGGFSRDLFTDEPLAPVAVYSVRFHLPF
jgi:hypothetical protein